MKQLRWGILGAAAIADRHMIAAINESGNGTVHAIASRNYSHGIILAEKHNIPVVYGNYDDLLKDPDIDAIYLPLPTGLHCEWAVKCAEAKKPVLCEKPIAASMDEAVKMEIAFDKNGVLLAESFMFKYHPLTKMVKKIIDEGGVGKVNLIKASFSALIDNDNDIRYNKEMGGGAMLDLGSYCVSMIRMIVGEEPKDIRAVATIGAKNGVDESMTGVMSFPGGALGYLGVSMRNPFECSYDIIGTRGRVLVDTGAMVAWPGSEFVIQHWHDDTFAELIAPAANHYQLIAAAFADAVIHNTPMAYPITDSINNMAVIDNMLRNAGVKIEN